jgi:hypothetical protein
MPLPGKKNLSASHGFSRWTLGAKRSNNALQRKVAARPGRQTFAADASEQRL